MLLAVQPVQMLGHGACSSRPRSILPTNPSADPADRVQGQSIRTISLHSRLSTLLGRSLPPGV
ncbi:MAG: hypothetical protein ACLU3I_22375 [Acutalibacteraceae bacterium]